MTPTVTQLLLAAALVLVSLGLWTACHRFYVRWLRRRQWSRARAAEDEAPNLLRQLGYEVLGAQVEGSYSLVVDSQPMTVSLRADYVVARDGLQYIAEVKSGRFAPRLENAATRRQLLEYRIAFDVDGVLLVDGETKRVREITFPLTSQIAPISWLSRRLAYTAVLLGVVAILALLCAR
jgi:hypothetical protein